MIFLLQRVLKGERKSQIEGRLSEAAWEAADWGWPPRLPRVDHARRGPRPRGRRACARGHARLRWNIIGKVDRWRNKYNARRCPRFHAPQQQPDAKVDHRGWRGQSQSRHFLSVWKLSYSYTANHGRYNPTTAVWFRIMIWRDCSNVETYNELIFIMSAMPLELEMKVPEDFTIILLNESTYKRFHT